MTNKILLAGFGKMGGNYAKNLGKFCDRLIITDSDLSQCRKALTEYPNASVYWVGTASLSNDHGILIAEDIADIVRRENINGLINATSTNNHLDVVESALSVVGGNGQSVIRGIVQEKPFGLFDDSEKHFDRVANLIACSEVKFSLNSILMFSDIWTHVQDWVELNGGLDGHVEVIESKCIYGKDRTKDSRPAFEGVFGTDATHAIDILRGNGGIRQSFTFGKSKLISGPIGIERNVPYVCEAFGKSSSGGNAHLNMSLAFDQNYRCVTHLIRKADGEEVLMRLDFDKGGRDIMQTWDADGISTGVYIPSNTKLKNSIAAVFDGHSNFEPYDLSRVVDLRKVMSNLYHKSQTTLMSDAPKIVRPNTTITT